MEQKEEREMYKLMAKLLCILISFGLIVLSTPKVFGGERLYDFTNDDAWEPIAANWEIMGGEYIVKDPADPDASIAVLKESEGIDTRDVDSIEFVGYDLGTGPWQNMLIVFGFDETKPVIYGIGPWVGPAQSWRLVELDSKTKVYTTLTWLARKSEVLGPKKWYHVKIEFDGDTIILYGAEGDADLQEKLRYEFPDGKPSGRIGISGVGSHVKFDDFRVTGPWTKSLAVVVPKDKLPMAWGKIKAGPGL
jgi:hypothetical protein